MNIVFIQSSSLSIERAHWIQILNTAWAFANRADVHVTVMPRAFAANVENEVLEGMGFQSRENLRFVPVWAPAMVQRMKFRGDPFSLRQGRIARHFALKKLKGVLSGLSPGPLLVCTRDQEVPLIAGDALKQAKATIINEHHKFEYVKRLEGKLQKKRPGRRTLGDFKEWARAERSEEVRRLGRFGGVVCTTPSIRSRLMSLGFEKPTTWIPNGARLPLTDASPHGERDIDILYVGQLLRWKNVDELIEAMTFLPNRRLTVVGGGPGPDMDRLTSLAERLGVESRVDFRGQRPHGEIHGIMQRARLGVVPLPRAGFPEARLFCNPLKALELMAAGTPVVATRLKSVEGLLDHDRNAYLVQPDDPKALADGIKAVLESPKLAARLASEGLKKAAELSYDSRADRVLAFARSCGLPA